MFERPTVQHARRGWGRVILAVLLTLLVVSAVGALVIWRSYNQRLLPVSSSQEVVLVDIKTGTAAAGIAGQLQERGLIRSSNAFQWYVRSNGTRDKLQAGTYALRPSMSVGEIVDVLTSGQVKNELLTILPGQRIDQVRQTFINAGYAPAAVDAALSPAAYDGHPLLADLPDTADSLEGLLAPESYGKTDSTDPTAIVRQALDQMARSLTPAVRSAYAAQGLNVYQGITLASIVEKEVNNPADAAKVAQVFLKRLRLDMSLQSDPTTLYGAVRAGGAPSLRVDSVYNTYRIKGLTPTPISSVTERSLQAVASPADTDWLYFVAGDDGTTHFSNSLEEHEALTERYCKRLCSGAQ